MNRKRLVTLLQCALAAGLLAVVFLFLVQWKDIARPRAVAGGPALTGQIVGPEGHRPWEAPEVTLRVAREGPVPVNVVVKSAEFDVQPGMLTLAKHLDLRLWAAGAGLLLVGAYLAAVRWWLLVRVLSIPFTIGASLKWSFVAFFFNNVVPGLIGGDLPKMYFVARETDRKTHAVLSIVVDRIIGLLALGIVAGTAYLLDRGRYQTPELGLVGWFLAAVNAILILGLVVAASRRVRGFVLPAERLAKLPGGKLVAKVDEALHLYSGRPGVLVVALALSLSNHALSMVAWWLFAKALGGLLTIGACFVVVPVVQMAKSAPIAPAGWGIGEGLFAKLLPLYGESATLGVALSITYQLTYLLFSLAGGVILATLPARDRVSSDEMQRTLQSAELPTHPA